MLKFLLDIIPLDQKKRKKEEMLFISRITWEEQYYLKFYMYLISTYSILLSAHKPFIMIIMM